MRRNTFQNRTLELVLKNKKFENDYELIEGMIVDYYLPQSNTVIVSIPTFMIDNTNEYERGYSRTRDLILKKSKANPKILKVNIVAMRKAPKDYFEKLFK